MGAEKTPGTFPSVYFGHLGTDRNSDLVAVLAVLAVFDVNNALRKSERTMGTGTICRTNWWGATRVAMSCLHRGRRYGLESGTGAIAYVRILAYSISRHLVA